MTQNDGFVIRRAEQSDIERIVQIAKNNCKNPWNSRQFEEELSYDFCYLYCGELDGELAGFLDMHIAGDEAHVNEIAVDGLFRRRGIGDRLMHACITEAMSMDCSVMTLEVREQNIGARKFYGSLGFHPAGVRKQFYQNPPDNAVMMQMALTGWSDSRWGEGES